MERRRDRQYALLRLASSQNFCQTINESLHEIGHETYLAMDSMELEDLGPKSLGPKVVITYNLLRIQ